MTLRWAVAGLSHFLRSRIGTVGRLNSVVNDERCTVLEFDLAACHDLRARIESCRTVCGAFSVQTCRHCEVSGTYIDIVVHNAYEFLALIMSPLSHKFCHANVHGERSCPGVRVSVKILAASRSAAPTMLLQPTCLDISPPLSRANLGPHPRTWATAILEGSVGCLTAAAKADIRQRSRGPSFVAPVNLIR